MNKTCLALLFSTMLASHAYGDILAQWNFNSVPPDTATTSGSTNASAGTGALVPINGTTQTFSSAASTGAGSGQSTDPATSDNTAYHTGNYAAQGAGNKTRGIQVNVSTIGYESIVVSWDQRQSSSTSKYFRFQYSLDGVNFVDGPAFTTDTADRWFTGRSVDLNSIVGANQNSNFAFR